MVVIPRVKQESTNHLENLGIPCVTPASRARRTCCDTSTQREGPLGATLYIVATRDGVRRYVRRQTWPLGRLPGNDFAGWTSDNAPLFTVLVVRHAPSVQSAKPRIQHRLSRLHERAVARCEL